MYEFGESFGLPKSAQSSNEPGTFLTRPKFTDKYGLPEQWKQIGEGDVFRVYEPAGEQSSYRVIKVQLRPDETLPNVLTSLVASSRRYGRDLESEMTLLEIRNGTPVYAVAEKRAFSLTPNQLFDRIEQLTSTTSINDSDKKLKYPTYLSVLQAIAAEICRAHGNAFAIFDFKLNDGFVGKLNHLEAEGNYVDYSTVFLMPPVSQLEQAAVIFDNLERFLDFYSDGQTKRIDLTSLEKDFQDLTEEVKQMNFASGLRDDKASSITAQRVNYRLTSFLLRYPKFVDDLKEKISAEIKRTSGLRQTPPTKIGLLEAVFTRLTGGPSKQEIFEQDKKEYQYYIDLVMKEIVSKVTGDLQSLRMAKWLSSELGVERIEKEVARLLGFSDETLKSLLGLENVFASYLIPDIERSSGLKLREQINSIVSRVKTVCNAEKSFYSKPQTKLPEVWRKWWIAVQRAETKDWEIFASDIENGSITKGKLVDILMTYSRNGFTEIRIKLEELINQRNQIVEKFNHDKSKWSIAEAEKEILQIDNQIYVLLTPN